MLREQPVVPLKVLDTVLQFAVHGFVKVFDDFGTRRFGSRVVCLHIFYENGEALRIGA